MTDPQWQLIWTAPCTDTFVMLRYSDGREFLTDLDYGSDPEWWAQRGAIQWRYPTDAEYELVNDEAVRLWKKASSKNIDAQYDDSPTAGRKPSPCKDSPI